MSSKAGILMCLVMITSILSACGGGGGLPPAAPSSRLDGTVTDAVITNGTLRVYAFDGGVRGELLAETVTDGQGDFVFENFSSPDRPIVIEVRGGRYTEEASGVSVNLLDGQALRAYLFYEQGAPITVQITPLTHLASCLADYKISNGINVNNAITESTSVFSGMTGVDILGARPLDITDPNNANFEVTDSLRYGTLLAAISSFTAEVSQSNGVTPHRFNQNSSIYATQVLCQDLAADGIFNGQGYINNGNSVGQLSLGSVPLDADTFRADIAQHILSIISSDRNNTSLGVDDFVLYANEVASSTDAVFGGIPATPVDQAGPVSTALMQPDSFIKGLVDLEFTVSDPIGVKSVQFEINGLPHSVGQTSKPVLSLNTTNYTDGVVTITVVARDVLNNESRTDFSYVVDNTSPTVAMTSPLLTNNKSYTATGTFAAEGAPIAAITVNGINASIDTQLGAWTADISLLSGDNTVTVQITDTVGNANSIDVAVGVDLILPSIVPVGTQVDYTTFQGQLNLCNTGQLTQTSANGSPVCVSTDNASLNGAALNGDIQFQGYVLLGFSVTDPQGAGVFTSQSDLIVEYKYEKDGAEIIPWTTAPKSTVSSGVIYYFPMVTEYLGIDWYKTTTSDVHRVTFKVTDNAGNSKELFYELQFDVLVPEIVATSQISNKGLFNTTFAARSSIDGQLVRVEYAISNPSTTAYYISLTDSQANAVSHIYESGIRENFVRIKVSEQWFARNCGTLVYGSQACPDGPEYPVSTVTFTRSDRRSGQTITPAASQYTAYEAVQTDVPDMASLTGDVNITPLSQYSCEPTDLTYTSVEDKWDWLAIANGNASFTVCRFLDSSYTWPSNFTSSLRSVVSKNIEYKPGFPKNNITEQTVDYSMVTESISVLNDTLGQQILPVSNWYRVPENTDIRIIKTIRTPVIYHYNDIELADASAFASYQQKNLDKTTRWDIDTDMALTRAIDPGSVDQLALVTKYTETIGQGIQSFTVTR